MGSKSWFRRRAAKIGLAIVLGVGLVVVIGVVWLGRENDERVKQVAAPDMKCAADQIEIVEQFQGDTSETYELRGCSRTGSLMCSAPDFECVYISTSAVH